jgi:LAO/AO transport system kinase
MHPSSGPNVPVNNFKSLARILTKVENELPESDNILKNLTPNHTPVIGVTGPPGAGKSTLVNQLINTLSKENKRIAILAIDPSSPFNMGALLGDRIRMAEQFNKPNVFIRSLATRGSLGGVSAKTIQMTDVLKSADFDYIFIETVGVGQSEIEIVGVADITIVVLVPEAGDEIQSIKSGLMEIADIFAINKADRDGADLFANTIQKLVHQKSKRIPVIKTIAERSEGISALLEAIKSQPYSENKRKLPLLFEKAWKLIQDKRMSDIDKKKLQQAITEASKQIDFNLYRFIEKF